MSENSWKCDVAFDSMREQAAGREVGWQVKNSLGAYWHDTASSSRFATEGWEDTARLTVLIHGSADSHRLIGM